MYSLRVIFAAATAAALAISANAQCAFTHIVVSGDTCFSIAADGGVQVCQLQAANPGLNCDNLQIGQALCVPGAGQACLAGKQVVGNVNTPAHN